MDKNVHDHPDHEGGAALLECDYERYAAYLDGEDISEDQKRAFIEALWSVMVGFVDLGFGVDSLSYVFPEILGTSGSAAGVNGGGADTLLESENNTNAAENAGKGGGHD
ncbi:MAG: hypothetical protein AAGA72_13590 [Pseudomonadota bacterium]